LTNNLSAIELIMIKFRVEMKLLEIKTK